MDTPSGPENMPSPTPRSEGHVSCLPAGARPRSLVSATTVASQGRTDQRGAGIRAGGCGSHPEGLSLSPSNCSPPSLRRERTTAYRGLQGGGAGGPRVTRRQRESLLARHSPLVRAGGPLSATVMRICSGPMTHAEPGSLLGRAPVMVSLSFSCLFSEMLSDLVVVTPPCTLSQGS